MKNYKKIFKVYFLFNKMKGLIFIIILGVLLFGIGLVIGDEVNDSGKVYCEDYPYDASCVCKIGIRKSVQCNVQDLQDNEGCNAALSFECSNEVNSSKNKTRVDNVSQVSQNKTRIDRTNITFIPYQKRNESLARRNIWSGSRYYGC